MKSLQSYFLSKWHKHISPPPYHPSIKAGTENNSDRTKWVEEKLNDIPKGKRILDAGAGELRYKPFCTHLDYVAQDFNMYDGKGDGKSLQMGSWEQSEIDIICDIVDIPEPDNSFDVILCSEVFEHLPEPIKAIKEFSRLLKKSGKLILTAPFCSLSHFTPYHFYSGLNRYWYEKFLIQHGFKIIEIVQRGNYFEFIAQELIRLESIAIEYSGKNIEKTIKKPILQVLRFLDDCSKADTDSRELLCYGYHVFAEKE